MENTIMQFFDVLGLSSTAPETFPELITWFVFVLVGALLVLGVFRLIGSLIGTLMTGGRL